MATAKQIVATVKAQKGNAGGRKFWSAYGFSSRVAWCCCFVWWVFKQHKMSPFGKTAYVPTAASTMRSKGLHRGGAKQAKAGDIRVVTGESHIGICVKDGGAVIAGNSGDAVRNEGAGGTYYRPNYQPDIIKIVFGDKTYYYNPKTKKVCSDKAGKNPIVTPSQSGGGKSPSGSPKSSGGGKTATHVYKEYYVTKPEDFVHAKEQEYISKEIVLDDSNRKKQLVNDLKNILQLLPNNNEIQNILNNLVVIHDLNANALLNYYTKIVQILQKELKPYNYDNQECYAITGTLDEFRMAYQINYEDRNQEYPQMYYNIMTDEWLNLFNDMTLKRDALIYYLDTVSSYQSPLFSKKYNDTRLLDMKNIYSNQINSLYHKINNYTSENIQIINTEDTLKTLNRQITNNTLDTNFLEKKLLFNYSEMTDIENKIKHYQDIYNKIVAQKDRLKVKNFSDQYPYWNKNTIEYPHQLRFWLDFASTGALDYNYYNIPAIGLRTSVTTNTNINSIYNREIPNIIYYDNHNIEQNKTGYNYLYLPDLHNNFVNSSQGISAKDAIDSLLYQHSYCAEEINLTTIPIYYLQPNNQILVYNKEVGINNKYNINKISIALQVGGTMQISATKMIDRDYIKG